MRLNVRVLGSSGVTCRDTPLFGSVNVKNGDKDKQQRAALRSPHKKTMLPSRFWFRANWAASFVGGSLEEVKVGLDDLLFFHRILRELSPAFR